VSFIAALLAGLLHSLCMFLAFAPVGLWGFALGAAAPLIWIAARDADVAEVDAGGRSRLGRLLRRWRAPLAGSLGVAPLWAYESQWVIHVSELGYIPMVPGLALFSGAFVGLLSRVRRRVPWIPLWIAAPVLWTGLEVFRGEVIVTGYAWLLLGQPLIDSVPGPLLASIVGAYGVSFLACLLAAAACAVPLARERSVKFGVGALAVVGVAGLVVPLLVGMRAASNAGGGGGGGGPSASGAWSMRIGVVQTNVPQDNKIGWTLESRQRDFARMVDLTRRAAAVDPKPDLIVWPETMFPGEMLEPIDWPDGKGDIEKRPLAPEMVEALFALQREIDVPLMVGALGVEGGRIVRGADGKPDFQFDRRFNSVFLIQHGELATEYGKAERYDKMELTPFGEVMPYVHHWPWLERMVMGVAANGMKFDLAAGERPRSLEVRTRGGATARLCTPICFEITKTAHCRRLARQGMESMPHPVPSAFVNLSNDGWFGNFDAGKRQHLLAARWRAAELGVPVVRAVNTGISCVIDASGAIVHAGSAGPLASRTEGVLVADVSLPPGGLAGTTYAAWGNVLGWACVIASGAIVPLTLVRGAGRAGGMR